MSAKIQLTFYPDKLRPPLNPQASFRMDSLELQAGENSLSSDEFELLKKHPDFEFFVRNGILLVNTVSPESEETEEPDEPEAPSPLSAATPELEDPEEEPDEPEAPPPPPAASKKAKA